MFWLRLGLTIFVITDWLLYLFCHSCFFYLLCYFPPYFWIFQLVVILLIISIIFNVGIAFLSCLFFPSFVCSVISGFSIFAFIVISFLSLNPSSEYSVRQNLHFFFNFTVTFQHVKINVSFLHKIILTLEAKYHVFLLTLLLLY